MNFNYFSKFAGCITVPVLMLAINAAVFAAEPIKTQAPEELTPERLASLEVKAPTFVYDNLARTDPFRPFFDFSRLERAIPTDTSQPLTPLEKYALNQFSLVGVILTGNGENYALMEDPERIGYTVRVGDKIGNLSGQVKDILANTVIIEEPYLDIFDQQKIRVITLKLRETDFVNPISGEQLSDR
ncbi:MAG: pilus assembly protein PilP [Deltaproteobacteria bacterium]|nr:pilus assembly protein PilP [Deltaproteobacteria bacterium]